MAKQKGNKGKGGAGKKSRGGRRPDDPPAEGDGSGGGNNRGRNNGNGGRKRGGRQKQNNKRQQAEDDDDKFRNTLLNQGHSVEEMEPDGNCLFRSLSDQLHHDSGSKHDLVRHDVCDHLEENKEEFRHFLLMGDDDEDVLDIDEYIRKMREDGEWGGNVEIVAASRRYGRDVKVFSGEYSNGVLSVVCDDREEGADDLLLSYHGNDHYNSIRPVGGFKKQPSARAEGNGDNAQQSTKSKKKGKAAAASSEDGDWDESVRVSHPMALDLEKSNKQRSRPPTRGSNCPCGSGLKYKRCCMAAEKSKKRLAKHLEKHGEEDGGAADDDEKKDDERFIGDFRVLTI